MQPAKREVVFGLQAGCRL